MAAMTLDHLSGGRFILGLGASGPQVVEGWYGQPYPRPLERTREYVEIIRRIIARDAPVEYRGQHYQMPYPGGMGLGKPLKSTCTRCARTSRSSSPPRARRTSRSPPRSPTAGCRCSSRRRATSSIATRSAKGSSARTARRKPEDFEVTANVPVIINNDVEAAADMLRPMLALYAGGMGARNANFHFDVLARLGYEEVCLRVQDLYLNGKKREAMAAIPTTMVEDTSLIGPVEKIRDDLAKWRETA